MRHLFIRSKSDHHLNCDIIVQAPVTHLEAVDEQLHRAGALGMLEPFAYTIHKITCEVSHPTV